MAAYRSPAVDLTGNPARNDLRPPPRPQCSQVSPSLLNLPTGGGSSLPEGPLSLYLPPSSFSFLKKKKGVLALLFSSLFIYHLQTRTPANIGSLG